MKTHIQFDADVESFIFSLEKETVAKVLRTIDLLGEFGCFLGPPHIKKIEKNIFELRVRGKQEVRLFYTWHKNIVVFLHGFIKKTQKIPKKELNTVRKKIRVLGQ